MKKIIFILILIAIVGFIGTIFLATNPKLVIPLSNSHREIGAT
jgi:hypothetical protein